MAVMVTDESFDVFLRNTGFMNIPVVGCKTMCPVQGDIAPSNFKSPTAFIIKLFGRPVAINTLIPFSRSSVKAWRVEAEIVCVLNETNVPSISKKIAFTMEI